MPSGEVEHSRGLPGAQRLLPSGEAALDVADPLGGVGRRQFERARKPVEHVPALTEERAQHADLRSHEDVRGVLDGVLELGTDLVEDVWVHVRETRELVEYDHGPDLVADRELIRERERPVETTSWRRRLPAEERDRETAVRVPSHDWKTQRKPVVPRRRRSLAWWYRRAWPNRAARIHTGHVPLLSHLLSSIMTKMTAQGSLRKLDSKARQQLDFERKPFYSPKEVGQILGISTQTVLERIHSSDLYGVRISERIYRIPLAALLVFLGEPTRVRRVKWGRADADRFWQRLGREHRARPR